MRLVLRNSLRLQERRRQEARLWVAQSLLPAQALRLLGHGVFSTVWMAGPRRVFKVTDAQDTTAMWCHRWTRRQPNVHWPRIHKAIKTRRTLCSGWNGFGRWFRTRPSGWCVACDGAKATEAV